MKGREAVTGWSTEMGWNFWGQHCREERWKQLPRPISVMRRLETCFCVVHEGEILSMMSKFLFVCLVFLVFVFVWRNQIHSLAFKEIKMRRTSDVGIVGEKLSC